ncbi:MAG: hypothetical protein KF826_15760 [Xanthobacteraceae bacterium]|nr:hypothetical protein [Xanthobacteraceae bacterium]MCW5678412.1 hypothetical protein [Xanthobacteraceae bacterium]
MPKRTEGKRLTKPQDDALRLLNENDGTLSCDDERCDKFSDDGDPDTWNQLFNAGLARQSGPGWSGDDFAIHITPAGRAALKAGASE